eukprot:PhF_6_TR17363/c0_g1_i1/m.26587
MLRRTIRRFIMKNRPAHNPDTSPSPGQVSTMDQMVKDVEKISPLNTLVQDDNKNNVNNTMLYDKVNYGNGGKGTSRQTDRVIDEKAMDTSDLPKEYYYDADDATDIAAFSHTLGAFILIVFTYMFFRILFDPYNEGTFSMRGRHDAVDISRK